MIRPGVVALSRGTVLASAAIAVTYLLVPGHQRSWLPGLPLGPLALAALVVLGIALFGCWPAPDSRSTRLARAALPLLAALTALKLLLGLLGPDYGLDAWYYANSRFQGPHERSTDFPGLAATRRDRALDFGGDEFPLYFFNDVQRFNFFGDEADRRRSLPFSVRWRGTLYVPRDGEYRFWLSASGPATLTIDGRQLAAVDAEGRETASVAVTLPAGSREVRVTYARRPPRSGDLKVEWDLDGRRRSVAAPYLLAGPISAEGWERDRWVERAARVVDLVFLAVLAAAALGLAVERLAATRRASADRWRLLERPLLAAFLLAVFAHAIVPRLDRADKMSLLGGGQDWLTHESLARDILLNGPLMTLGKPLGEGRTFYAQPFYPYALAGMHRLAGEAQFGPTVLQLLGLGVSGVLVYFVARRLFGVPAAIGTFVVFLGLRAWHLDWVARRLLSENVYVVVLPAALLCLLRYLDERRGRDLALAGVFLGLAVVTRGPTLLYLPLVAILLFWMLRRAPTPLTRRAAIGPIAALLAVTLAIAALVPLRNWIVAGQPALVSSSGGVNLQKLHRPTPKVRLNEAHRRWYAPYVEDVPTRETLEFIQQDPLGYAATYVPLALYTLGYGAAIDESSVVVWPDLVLINVLYLAAVIGSRRARSARAGLLHAFVAVHFATMVVFAPYDYDNRLVLPMYLAVAPFAGLALAGIAAWLLARRRADRAVAIRLAGPSRPV